ncbi:MAG TPA: hypothetical protein VFJ94_10010 [Intrasporangium sp.]|uniref:hypothetical protein n=1 Tax=Intrasporangium sp. TaxID=1925024 RepID=UPI002D792BF2|nr:hypothetical protein [Intrasporangium sp.]HET7398842.1 hypothetical protein [Intrasporangium sp.]
MEIRRPRTHGRAIALLPAGVALLAGLDAALLLLGLPAPVAAPRLGELHGMLMVVGFLGTLIALERAVALRSPLGYAAPALLGLGSLALLSPLPQTLGKLLLVDGALALVAVYAALLRRTHDDVVLVELLAALLVVVATGLWLRVDVPWLLPWLVGFVVLTICAERVELARLVMPATGGRTLVLLASALVVTLVLALLWPEPGTRAVGLVVGALVVWLVRHDVARRTVRASGLPRLSAAALLGGYGWLLVAGVAWAARGAERQGAAYDLVVHAVFLGFALSMVIAHAPVILPAVLRRPLPYRPVLWAPLGLLHASLVIRVAGDLGGSRPLWQTGSVLNITAVLLFVVVAAVSVAAGSRP